MNSLEKKTLRAIQHLVTTARFKAYHSESHEMIADLLDQADHLLNLVMEEVPSFPKIQTILQGLTRKFPECSSLLLSLEE